MKGKKSLVLLLGLGLVIFAVIFGKNFLDTKEVEENLDNGEMIVVEVEKKEEITGLFSFDNQYELTLVGEDKEYKVLVEEEKHEKYVEGEEIYVIVNGDKVVLD